MLMGVEADLQRVKADQSLKTPEKLTLVLTTILDRLQENKRLLSVVLNYLLHLSKSGTDTDYRVRKRTIRLRHILASIAIEGIRRGELKQVNVRELDDLLYGLIEAAIFRLVVLRRDSVDELRHAIELAVQQMAV